MNVQPINDKVDGIFERYNRPGSPGCALAVIVYQLQLYSNGSHL
jgi:hypothetical protein